MTIKILQEADIAKDIGDKNKYIGIKLNLVIADTAEGGAVTHPEIVDGVITYLQENDFHNLVVLEGSWIGDRTEKATIHDLSPDGSVDILVSPRGKVKKLSAYVAPKDACSACYGSLIYALDRLKEEGYLSGISQHSIAIGQGYKGQSGILGVGNCTRCFEKSVPGCTPKATEIVKFLKENKNQR